MYCFCIFSSKLDLKQETAFYNTIMYKTKQKCAQNMHKRNVTKLKQKFQVIEPSQVLFSLETLIITVSAGAVAALVQI